MKEKSIKICFALLALLIFISLLSGCIRQENANSPNNQVTGDVTGKIEKKTGETPLPIKTSPDNTFPDRVDKKNEGKIKERITPTLSPLRKDGKAELSYEDYKHIVNMKGEGNLNKINLDEFRKLSPENQKFVAGLYPREEYTIHARVWIELKKELDENRFGESERTWRASMELVRVLKQYVKKRIKIASIGCGHGPHISWLADAVGEEGKVYAIDLDANTGYFIDDCRRKWWKEHYGTTYPQVEFVKNNVKSICLPENSIDIAFMQQCHVFVWKYDEKGISNMTSTGESISKALKKDGLFIIFEGIQANAVSRIEIIKRVEKCGFKFQKEVDTGKKYYLFVFVNRKN